MEKLNNRVPLNLDQKTLADLEAYRTTLESHSGLRVSRSSVAASLIRTALASTNGTTSQPSPQMN